MHSHFVQRTNERTTARKFTSHLVPGRASFLLLRVSPVCALSFSFSLRFPLFLSLSLSRFSSISLSFRPPHGNFANGNAAAPTNSRPSALAGSLSLYHPPLSPFSPPLFPALAPHSERHRNSGWKSLNCTHSHARALFALMALSPGKTPSPRSPRLFRSRDLL